MYGKAENTQTCKKVLKQAELYKAEYRFLFLGAFTFSKCLFVRPIKGLVNIRFFKKPQKNIHSSSIIFILQKSCFF